MCRAYEYYLGKKNVWWFFIVRYIFVCACMSVKKCSTVPFVDFLNSRKKEKSIWNNKRQN